MKHSIDLLETLGVNSLSRNLGKTKPLLKNVLWWIDKFNNVLRCLRKYLMCFYLAAYLLQACTPWKQFEKNSNSYSRPTQKLMMGSKAFVEKLYLFRTFLSSQVLSSAQCVTPFQKPLKLHKAKQKLTQECPWVLRTSRQTFVCSCIMRRSKKH